MGEGGPACRKGGLHSHCSTEHSQVPTTLQCPYSVCHSLAEQGEALRSDQPLRSVLPKPPSGASEAGHQPLLARVLPYKVTSLLTL